MKKLIAALGIASSLCASGLLYPAAYVVRDVNRTEDTVTIESATGNQFRFSGCEDWENGDLCACIMFSNGTKTVTDDQILAVRYCGFEIEN